MAGRGKYGSLAQYGWCPLCKRDHGFESQTMKKCKDRIKQYGEYAVLNIVETRRDYGSLEDAPLPINETSVAQGRRIVAEIRARRLVKGLPVDDDNDLE